MSRSEGDSELALLVWSRPEIPREYLLTLFETASETVRVKFETADRGKTDLVRDMIKQAADQIQTQLATIRLISLPLAPISSRCIKMEN